MRYAVVDATGAFLRAVDLGTTVAWDHPGEGLIADPPEGLDAGWHFDGGAWKAPGERRGPPIPAISDRQFAQALGELGVVTEDEAEAWAASGTLPARLTAAIAQLPTEARFPARMLLRSATLYKRDHPLAATLGALLPRPDGGTGWSDADLDALWLHAGTL